MFTTGLLVLTAPLNQLSHRIAPILHYAAGKVDKILYVHLQPNYVSETESNFLRVTPTTDLCAAVTRLHTGAANLCSRLDIRILLGNVGKPTEPLVYPRTLQNKVEFILTDCVNQNNDNFKTFMEGNYVLKPFPKMEFLKESDWKTSSNDNLSGMDWSLPKSEELQTYGHIVLGGTFDHVHAGHKILLSESIMRSERKITIGVTSGPMLESKSLCELIQPVETRITDVRNYIQDVKPHILFDDSVVPITDPFGPSIVVPDMGGIVVSEETRKGGDAVNKRRKEKGLSQLDVHVIDIVDDTCHASHEETKISSSSQRIRLLGTLLRAPQDHQSTSPYIIGLTGGIASGKTSVCKRLEKLGAAIINCDQLGHKAYEPGMKAYEQVVKEFGQDVVGADGLINRKALGAKVFADKSRLEVLNQIVWPEIARMAKEQIQQLTSKGHNVCVLDAAVLLEAGWQDFVNEIWVCVIPKDEALRRITDRDSIPEEKARQRIESQISNQARVDQANVVLSTLWEPEVTQKQVESAWELLQERLSETSPPRPKQPKI
ncbi:bifunctional coenzyme A synthase-like [Amphiura filiformis]|uniref:bifunctional coenzyme A synthase-like n=1 Tax=Amphiura filiformis TaxID=82378 RepID=UPI003B20E788